MDVKITYDGRLPYMRKPSKILQTEKLILGRSLIGAISNVCKKSITYPKLVEIIDSLSWETENEKRLNVIPMLMTGYFLPQRKGVAEILLSPLAITKLLSLFKVPKSKIQAFMGQCVEFDYCDYERHYHKWINDKEVLNEVQKSVCASFTNPYKTRDEILKEYAIENTNNATRAELAFFKILEKAGVSFSYQYATNIGGLECIFDFFIEELGIVFEIDGLYHETSKQRELDRIRDNACAWNGLLVIRIPNSDILTKSDIIKIQVDEVIAIKRKNTCVTENI